jgi:hypothetical protein
MKKNFFVNESTVCGLFYNLSRAYEIALLGGFKIRLIKSSNRDGRNLSDNDLIIISNLFAGVDFIFEEDFQDIELDSVILHIELNMPDFNSIISVRNPETVNDIFKRVNDAQKNILPEFKLTESGKALLSSAFNRLDLDLNELNSIAEISKTISRLHNSKEIKLEYLAEAIQYLCYERKYLD